MDAYSGKRGGGGLMRPRKGNNITFRDAANDSDHNPQLCNRIGCSGKVKYNQYSKIGNSDKAKCTKPIFSPSNGNETIGSSSRSSSVITRAKGSFLDPTRNLPSQLEFDSSESAPEFVSSPNGSSTVTEIDSSSVQSKMRPREKNHNNFELNNRNTHPTSSVPSVSQSSLNGSNNRSRFGLKNMKCNSISDVVGSYSSSKSKSAGKNMMEKRISEGESSRGRKTTVDGLFYPSTSGISISEEDVSNSNSTMRLSYRQNERNSLSLQEPVSDITINAGGSSSLQQFSTNAPSSGSSSYSRSSSNDVNQATNMSFILSELGFTPFMNRGSFQRYNMDGISEALLALERIEQHEELTHEQVLALETGLYLSSFNLYDQHRDMRLDIDNMSYEELLALEERMGTVSTALTEDSLLKCLKRSIYETPSEVRVKGSGEDGNEIKCSICQEEYILGDEIGKLVECQHGFHSTCINQWLQVKNWCPICKAKVASSSSPESSY